MIETTPKDRETKDTTRQTAKKEERQKTQDNRFNIVPEACVTWSVEYHLAFLHIQKEWTAILFPSCQCLSLTLQSWTGTFCFCQKVGAQVCAVHLSMVLNEHSPQYKYK